MAEPDEQAPFRRHQRVVARVALPGVPAGTEGRVMYEAGFSWVRYRVQFVNGVERGSLDARHLMDRDEWRERERAELRAAEREKQRRIAEELRAEVRAARAAEQEEVAS